MIERETVLILGAGASAPYGLPLGAELRQLILQMSESALRQLPTARGEQRLSYIASTFGTAFRGSRTESIDAFLARRTEFVDLGRHAIAASLLPRESAKQLLHQDVEDDWYTYLLKRMDASWEDLPKNRISFVTFNYDRSLEMCLLHTFQHRYGKTAEEAFEMLGHFPIVHVYGSLGSLDSRNTHFVPYGGGGSSYFSEHIQQAASGLQIIAEGRDSSHELSQARALIEKADAVCFLGFGFDALNVSRLGGHKIIAGTRVTDEGFKVQSFASTVFGLTKAEIGAVASAVTGSSNRREVQDGMFNAKCLSALRESLILG